MLAHRLGRWPSINPTLGDHLVYAGCEAFKHSPGADVNTSAIPRLCHLYPGDDYYYVSPQSSKHKTLAQRWANVIPRWPTIQPASGAVVWLSPRPYQQRAISTHVGGLTGCTVLMWPTSGQLEVLLTLVCVSLWSVAPG